jgi:hypothetical protein
MDQMNDAHHMDNQRRFIALEKKLDANTAATEKLAADTEKLAADTSDLLAMWRDAGVVFKWIRKAGAAIVWMRNVALAALALYALWRYGSDGK